MIDWLVYPVEFDRPRSNCSLLNRAACFQQMREPKLALTDVQHVLAFDPTNAKAIARKQVYEGQLAGGM